MRRRHADSVVRRVCTLWLSAIRAFPSNIGGSSILCSRRSLPRSIATGICRLRRRLIFGALGKLPARAALDGTGGIDRRYFYARVAVTTRKLSRSCAGTLPNSHSTHQQLVVFSRPDDDRCSRGLVVAAQLPIIPGRSARGLRSLR